MLASVVAASICLVQREAPTAALTVQRAQAEITPPEPLPLGGYTARGGKLMDPGGGPLFARIAVLSQGPFHIAVVSVEMLTVPESLVREVRRKIPSSIELFLVATHTHCAPDSQMLNDRMTFQIPGIASYKTRWLEWYSDRIASGIRSAIGTSGVAVGRLFVRCQALPLNRGRRIGAFPDPVATLVAYEEPGFHGTDLRNGVGTLMFHFAAHATFLGPDHNRTAGDWPGAVSRRMDALVIPGAIGDVSPSAPNDLDPSERVDYAAKLVSDRFPVAFSRSIKARPARWLHVPIALDPPKAHPEFSKANRIPDFLAQQLAEKFAPKEATVTAFRIGKLAVVGIPGEPTSHLGRKIRDYGRNLGFDPVLVCSHVNGWMGYILDANDYGRGGYEATLSMFGPEQGGKVVEAAKRALDQLTQDP